MTRAANNIWVQVGFEPEERLRWLLRFGNLERAALTVDQRNAIRQEALAFAIFQELDPALRGRLRSLPPPDPAAPNTLDDAEVWRAQLWLKRGLKMLGRAEKWNFAPRVKYELDAHRGLLWTRLKADSRLEQFKALTFEVFRDARFKFRLCPRCRRAFVPIRRQAYCSARCSQTVRTRKWRKAHPEKNRAIRRSQYRKSIAAKLKLSKKARVRIAKPQGGSRK
jgi:hypothetical protein